MTRTEFDTFLAEATARGFSKVLVGQDHHPIALEQWHPYGAFGGSNPGIEDHIHGFTWIGHDTAVDTVPDKQHPGDVYGAWTFVP